MVQPPWDLIIPAAPRQAETNVDCLVCHMEFPNAKSKHDFFTQQTYCVGQSKHHQPLNLDHYLCTLKYMCTYIQGCQTGLRIDSALSEEGQIFAPKFLSGKI